MKTAISTAAFEQIRSYVYRTAGIQIGAEKTAMVIGRLWRRLDMLGCNTFEEYLKFVRSAEGAPERATMLDLLTTNETYFFREPAHFELLRKKIIPQQGNKKLRVWCGASSTGEEPYSLAMVLADCRALGSWEVVASDISGKVLEQARAGIYRMERLDYMPAEYLKRFCLRGTSEFEGKFAITPSLRKQVHFTQHNLLEPLADGEGFDVVFLRNVLIYFDQPTKQKVLDNVMRALRPGGWLILSHCETLQGLDLPVRMHSPSIYTKTTAAPVTSIRSQL
jgi:chemotaxis protein methyltransferase CheR